MAPLRREWTRHTPAQRIGRWLIWLVCVAAVV
jgi:phosphonate transport system permease protein